MDEVSAEVIVKNVIDAATSGQVTQGCEDVYSDAFLIRSQGDGLQALQRVRSTYREYGIGVDASIGPQQRKFACQENIKKLLMVGTCRTSVLLCATYDGDYEWSNESCRKTAKGLLEDILCATSSSSAFRLLCGYSEEEDPPPEVCIFEKGIAAETFQLLNERLNKADWKREPASREIFWWLLSLMKHPFVGVHLNYVLPPALLLVDDYQSSNKRLGVRCLRHIIDEVDPTELRWHGRSEVVYQALEPLLYQQDGALMGELLPCLLRLLAATERRRGKVEGAAPRRPDKYDRVFQIVLGNMEGEQKLGLRRKFAEFLPEFVATMKVTVLRHMKRLLRVIVGYLEVSDGKEEITRLYTLDALKTTIIETWPRMPAHSVHLTKVLLALLCDISTEGSFNITNQAREQLGEKVEVCLRLLGRCDRGTTTAPALRGIVKTSPANQFVREALERVLEDG